jgi:hypothetical protein
MCNVIALIYCQLTKGFSIFLLSNTNYILKFFLFGRFRYWVFPMQISVFLYFLSSVWVAIFCIPLDNVRCILLICQSSSGWQLNQNANLHIVHINLNFWIVNYNYQPKHIQFLFYPEFLRKFPYEWLNHHLVRILCFK